MGSPILLSYKADFANTSAWAHTLACTKRKPTPFELSILGDPSPKCDSLAMNKHFLALNNLQRGFVNHTTF